MKFRNHRAVGVPFGKARWIGEEITPVLVVLHDTASRLAAGNVEAYLRNNTARTSVHFIIARDGRIEQQVPTNRRANHAGKSHYHGREWCNGFSIGIEMTNPGRMSDGGGGYARTWWGEKLQTDLFDIERKSTPEHGDHLWMPPTEAQITSCLDLLHGLFDYVPTLEDIRAHWYISPGRKVDVNPLFPLDHIRSQVLGREERAERRADEHAVRSEFDDWAMINTPGDTLNMRRWPSFNPNVIAAIPHGTAVPVISQGVFDHRDWFKVVYAGQEGWVIGQYISAVEALA